MPINLAESTPDRLAYLLRESIPSLPIDFTVNDLVMSAPTMTGSLIKNTSIDVLGLLNYRGLKTIRYSRISLNLALATVTALPTSSAKDLYGLLPDLLAQYQINLSQDDVYNEPIVNGVVKVMAKPDSYIFTGAATLPFDVPAITGPVIGLDGGSLFQLDAGGILANN